MSKFKSSAVAAPAPPEMGFRLRPADLHWSVILQLACCVAPAMGAVFIGHPLAGARYLVGALSLVLGCHVMRRDRFAYLGIVLGSLPVLDFMRGLFVYYSVIALLGGGGLMWMALSPARLLFLWRDLTWRWMTFGLALFWWLSMLLTGTYTTNLRCFELVLSSACIVLIAERRSYLATALLGMSLSATLLGLGLLPYGDRLGMGTIDDTRVGNPILLGMPCAMLVVLSLCDGGRWMFLERRILLRISVCLMAAEWLILSASRGSWIAALVGILVILALSSPDRKALFAAAALAAVVAAIGLSTERGQNVATQFDKTVDSNRTLANRTSGRSIQWSVMPLVFAESPIWGWGPGSGKDVAAIYTRRHLGWHALYLQVVGESGLIGSAALLVFLGSLVRRAFRHWKRFHEITPLAMIVTYMAVAGSVSGFDATSGIFVGLAMLAGDVPPRLMLMRERVVAGRAA